MGNNYLIRTNKRYTVISPGAIYESQVQQIVKKSCDAMFPEYELIDLEPYFVTAAGDVRPDFLLLKHDLSSWAVVEVELGIHSFTAHVLPQLAKLTFARADESLIAKVIGLSMNASNSSSIEACLSMRPRVILVTHGDASRRQDHLDELGVEAFDIVVHAALDAPNEYVLEVTNRVSRLTDLGMIAQRVSSPATPNIWQIQGARIRDVLLSKTEVAINANEKIAKWGVRVTNDGALLLKPRDLDLGATLDSARVFWDMESEVLHLIR